MIDAVVPSLNTLYSQRFKGSIGYQAATEVTDQGLSRSNSYIMNLWNPNRFTPKRYDLRTLSFGYQHRDEAQG